jgi:hypothetical protein
MLQPGRGALFSGFGERSGDAAAYLGEFAKTPLERSRFERDCGVCSASVHTVAEVTGAVSESDRDRDGTHRCL